MTVVSSTVTLPVWLAAIVAALALWSVLDRLLLPSVRWLLRRRSTDQECRRGVRTGCMLQEFAPLHHVHPSLIPRSGSKSHVNFII